MTGARRSGAPAGEDSAAPPAGSQSQRSQIAWLLARAAHFRRLAQEYRTMTEAAAAGHRMLEVAQDLESQAAALRRALLEAKTDGSPPASDRE